MTRMDEINFNVNRGMVLCISRKAGEVRMKRRITSPTVTTTLCAVLLLFGCADTAETAPDGGTPNTCAPGLKPMGPACVPIFDECQEDEVPMLGGGGGVQTGGATQDMLEGLGDGHWWLVRAYPTQDEVPNRDDGENWLLNLPAHR